MKKSLIFLIISAMLVGLMPVISVSAADKIVWNADIGLDGKWYNNGTAPAPNQSLSEDFTRANNQSFKTTTVETLQYFTYGRFMGNWSGMTPLNIDSTGMNYVNTWVYSTSNTPWGIPYTALFQLKDGSFTTTTSATITVNKGWNLLSVPINDTCKNQTLAGVRMYIHKGEMSVSATRENGPFYVESIWMSEKEPADRTFTSSSPANDSEGTHPIIETTSRLTLKGEVAKIAADANITISPSIGFTSSIENGSLVLNLTEALAFGEAYTVTVAGGVYDKFGMEYGTAAAPYTLNFRVRREDENIPPSVSLITPAGNERYMPNSEITLSASASDTDGTVAYVEFYADGVLIEGSRVTEAVDGVYTYNWTCTEDSLDKKVITALACDNGNSTSTSEGAEILVASMRYPELSIISPESEAEINKTVSGVVMKPELGVSIKSSDADGSIEKAEVYLDGELKNTYTGADLAISGNEASLNATLTTPSKGEHTIRVVVTDNDGQSTEKSVKINVVEVGKKFPAAMADDLRVPEGADVADTDYAKWTKTGVAKFSPDAEGILAKQTSAGNSSASRQYTGGLGKTPWQIDISLIPLTLGERTVSVAKLGTLAELKADGTIYSNGAKTNATYKAGQKLALSAVVNPEDGKAAFLIDGTVVASGISFTATDFNGGATASVSWTGAGETVISGMSVYKMTETAIAPTVSYGSGIAKDAVPCNISEIIISSAEGIVAGKDDIYLIDTFTGKRAAAEVSGGTLKLKELLQPGSEYELVVSGDVHNSQGAGIGGNYSETFKTVADGAYVIRNKDKTKFSSDRLTSATGLSLDITIFNNTDDAAREADIVIAVFDGNTIQKVVKSDETLSSVKGENAFTLDISALTGFTLNSNTHIEVFAVDDIDTLNPISRTPLTLAQ